MRATTPRPAKQNALQGQPEALKGISGSPLMPSPPREGGHDEEAEYETVFQRCRRIMQEGLDD